MAQVVIPKSDQPGSHLEPAARAVGLEPVATDARVVVRLPRCEDRELRQAAPRRLLQVQCERRQEEGE
jgi:hypothetical protein